jgi:hypothetical protein
MMPSVGPSAHCVIGRDNDSREEAWVLEEVAAREYGSTSDIRIGQPLGEIQLRVSKSGA